MKTKILFAGLLFAALMVCKMLRERLGNVVSSLFRVIEPKRKGGKMKNLGGTLGLLSLMIFLTISAYAQPSEILPELSIRISEGAGPLSIRIEKGVALTGITSVDALNRRYGVVSVERMIDPGPVGPRNPELFYSIGLDRLYRFVFPEGTDMLDAAENFSRDSFIEFAETVEEAISDDFFPNDTYFSNQWGFHNTGQTGGTVDADMDGPEGWGSAAESHTVTIAFISTGIEWYHEDFKDCWQNLGEDFDNDGQVLEWNGTRYVFDSGDTNGVDNDGNGKIDDFIGWDFVGNDNDPDDADPSSHGTKCAGVASAAKNNSKGIAGMAGGRALDPFYIKGCRMMPVRGRSGGTSITITNAIYYAADNGADVLSMSWHYDSEQSNIKAALTYAYGLGCILVASSGNESNSSPNYPAAWEESGLKVIAVGATDHNDARRSSSCYGSWLDIVAPGENIWTTTKSNGYGGYNGTSFSAPAVAGLAAIVRCIHPGMSNEEIAHIIYGSAEDDLGGSGDSHGRDNYYGYGRINMYRALKAQFTQSSQTPGGVSTTGCILGDLDNDGDLDFIAGKSGWVGNEIYWNNGSGTFSYSGIALGSQSTEDIAAADLDNDGYLDIIAANYDNGGNRIYLNNGDSTFTCVDTLYHASPAEEVSVADVDHDGDVDLIFGDWSEVEIYTNDGNASFALAQSISITNGAWSLAAGDLNGDTYVDIVAGSWNSQQLSTYFNDGIGDFSYSGQTLTFSSGVEGIDLGDVDNDGDLDLGVGIRYVSNQLFKNNGSGSFTNSGQNLNTATTIRISFADINCDGDADWVEANTTGPIDNRVYWNNSQGVFWDSGDSLGNGYSTGLALGDIDGDTDLDMIVGNYGASPDPYNRVYFNNEDLVTTNQTPGTVTIQSCIPDSIAMSITLQWQAATDEHTPQASLTYDLRVGTSSGLEDIHSATLPAGPGNVGHTTTYKLKDLAGGTYYCAVRAVDNGFARGNWSTEVHCSLPSLQSDGFEDYPVGSDIVGQGGWEFWGGGSSSPSARVTNVQVHSGEKALKIHGTADQTGDDIVHQYSDFTSGVWVYTAWQFIPADAAGGTTYFILLNQYDGGGPDTKWSTQLEFDPDRGVVESEHEGATLPLAKGVWAEIRVIIDLDSDLQHIYYNGEHLVTKSWTEGVSSGGALNIAAVDLWTNTLENADVYYDDMSLNTHEFVRGDANGDGQVDIADVVYLINYLFSSGTPPVPLLSGDANSDGVVDIADAVYLINYLFSGGPPPSAGNPTPSSESGLERYIDKGPAQIEFSSPIISKDGIFEVPIMGKSDLDISAVQLEIKYDPEEITLLEPVLTPKTEGLNIYSSSNNGVQKIGILDLNGKHYISSGTDALVNLRIKGSDWTSLEITEAILVDRDAHKIPVQIASKMEESDEDIIVKEFAAPQEFFLSQNYPNPFNPKTEISYTLPTDCHVKLIIYNVAGQKVRTLVDQHQTSGYKTIAWNGKNDKGKELATGVYFYRIQAGDFRQSRKMVLVK